VSAGKLPALLALLGALAVPSGCGGTHRDPHATSASTGAASEATVRTANCNLWLALGQTDRTRLVAGLRAFFGARVDAPGARGQVLPDRYAYTLLSSYCRQPFAGAFMLYRLYGNAAAFTASHSG
jgi:hypothetical protein